MPNGTFVNILSKDTIYIKFIKFFDHSSYGIGFIDGENNESHILANVTNSYEVFSECNFESENNYYLMYNCQSYVSTCSDSSDCLQMPIASNSLYINKYYPTYLYEVDLLIGNEYAVGEFDYDNNLTFIKYESLKKIPSNND